MPIKIKTRLYGGFITSMLLVVGVGLISFSTFTSQYQQAASLKHSYKVLNQLKYIQNLLVEMEAGRRGFRSTNDKNFLEPYSNALNKIHPSLTEGSMLVSDNINQVTRINKLSDDIDVILNYWKGLGDDASTYTREIITRINYGEKVKLDVVRSGINEMMNVELSILNEREAANVRSVNKAITWLVLGIILILIIVGTLIYFILREFKSRTKAELDLKVNNSKLEELNVASEEKNWLLAGLAQLNECLQGVHSTNEICKKALRNIVDYLQLDAAALYIYNENSKTLELTSALGINAEAKKIYQHDEGYVGRASSGTKLLHLTQVPNDYVLVEGGVLNVGISDVIYAPLLQNKELRGVLELLTFKTFSEHHIAFLNMVDDIIAVAINSSQSREKVMELLEEVQKQKEELKTQQEELRQANEELNVQTEVLQTSEEELRVQEEELRQINSELNQKNETIENARQALVLKTKELETSNDYKSEFLANMSHELRTPLNSVLILARLLADNNTKNLTEKQVSHAKIIYKSGSDLLQLINDILDLSKIEAGKADVIIEEIDVENVALEMKQIFEVVAHEKSIDFTFEILESAPKTIRSDEQKLDQILKNLLSNALKFTPDKGKVHLQFSGENNDKNLKIVVTDTGIGISDNTLQLIFEAFQQADGAANRKYGGTGLGLSITRQLVKLLQGTVSVKSKEGEGSEFSVILPILFDSKSSPNPGDAAITEPFVLDEVAEQNVIKDDRNNVSPKDKVILIIEDDIAFATILRDLSKENGFKTIVAIQGDEGLYYANKYLPSAILLDMQLPVLSGGQVLKQLQTSPALKQIPVHIFSAAEANRIETATAFSYLQKPVSYTDLSDALLSIQVYLKSGTKKILLIAGIHIQDRLMSQLFKERNFEVECKLAKSLEEGIELAETDFYDCSIADISTEAELYSVELNTLHQTLAKNNTPLILYLDQDITINDELALRKVSEVALRQSPGSHRRLMDEMELFLYKLQEIKPNTKLNVTVSALVDNDLAAKKILLVDDDMRNVFALSAALEREEIEVITAADGKDALQALRDNKEVDLVLMDIMMPEMDGYEAIRHIRNELKLTRLPIIALTAKAMTGDREKCIEAGASDYITKPVDIQKLLSLMRVWLS